jgi:hypothetical protein
VFGLWFVELGVAGQRMGAGCVWSVDPVCDLRHSYNPNPGKRRRVLDRPDRTVLFDLQELLARSIEERHENSAEVSVTTYEPNVG